MSDELESCNPIPEPPKKRGRRRFVDPVEPDPNKECAPIYKRDRGRFEPNAERRVKTRNRQAKAERIARARDLFMSGVNKTRIAEEIGTTRVTIARWLAADCAVLSYGRRAHDRMLSRPRGAQPSQPTLAAGAPSSERAGGSESR